MRKCNCIGCGRERLNVEATTWIAVPVRKSSEVKMRYICPNCMREHSYSTENDRRTGNRKVHGFTFSWECETSESTIKARGELLDFDYLPTYDSTVDVEYKSPIFEGLPALSKQCVSIERLIADGDLRIGRECGSHLHVGHCQYINDITMRWLRRFNGSLFVPLSEAIMADPAKAERFFGRAANHWAEPVSFSDPSGDYDGWRMKHSAMFNLQHDYTIEFRQAKFVNAKQYMNVVKFGKDVTNAIIENFIKHFMDTEWDRTRYPKRTDYRKHKAQVTAKKLVKLYEKYSANC